MFFLKDMKKRKKIVFITLVLLFQFVLCEVADSCGWRYGNRLVHCGGSYSRQKITE